MRVLWIGFSNDRVEWELIRALRRRGVQGWVLPAPDTLIAKQCHEEGIPYVPVPFRGWFLRQARRVIAERLREEPFDIIHCVTNAALRAALSATRRLPVPPRILAYRGALLPGSRLPWSARFSYLHPRVARIVCVCNAVRDQLIRSGISPSRLAVIRKGHDPSWYHSAERSALEVWGVPSDAIRCAFAGTIRRVKGLDLLLEAFKDLPATTPLHLVLIGPIRDRRVQRLCQRIQRVHLTGFQKNAPELVGACDLFALTPPAREGWPKALLEAMAQGVPPIVTRVGGLPEAVEHERTGWIVPPGDRDALRDALLRLAGDAALRRRLGEAARARVAGALHFRHTVEQTLDLYNELCADPCGGEASQRFAADG